MPALHLALYALWGSALVFAIVELGLTAYVTTFWGSRQTVTWNPARSYLYPKIRSSTPAILIFILFAACWTILAMIACLVLPWLSTRKGVVSSKLNKTLAAIFVAIYLVTIVFWLAAFADIANMLNGNINSFDYLDAIIAFAVLLWLVFFTLLVLTILALCGVLASDLAGYQSFKKPQATDVPHESASAPARDVPMSTTPVAPSELSTHDAEALHNQPHSQAHSTSSPSAIASAELSGESVQHYHAHERPVGQSWS
ncbi:hypothetical protein NUU61_005796 [Penicillium alfredii]|uniref:MARVEL domain-containing protein n=1 Tax=Penicillium alfredii TaxID=1506179 RepID=A0A9W9FA29_9EURO|nr:uncharacterized protein NUU61_005796 [Penicillium alfredii]KAJ5096440.1 hypothetical protein NUU61_005796 [Penicillium alfredii]